ncbi:hypothetical protein GTP38_19860 [Duganella sp. FT94W]|uniref:Uncharacterized protein n=1 Tax=Duganella lactea TaxID=2692173 RepID=A0ABW9VAB6_9BURK|nr:hypothetical protein [Duganella lactea]MYM36589.1 hypothetical protein [Duganella lactea]
MKTVSLCVSGFLLLCSTAVMAGPLVDVTKIAGKDAKHVAHILGSSKCSKTKYGPRCEYRNGGIEVVFIGGLADWITISNLEDVPFNADALKALGLNSARPSATRPTVIRWDSIPGFLSVSLFKGSVGSDYAYVKVKTQ